MQNSYKFSVETVGLLQQLYKLETEDLADAQGFARGLKGFLAGIGVQAPQVGGVLSGLFTSDDAGSKVLQGNYKKNRDGTETTKESLQEAVKRQLGVLATEFEGLARRNLIINKIATGGRITARQARILQADKQIREITEYDVRVTGNVTTTPSASQPTPPAGSAPEGYIEGTVEGKPVWIKVGAGAGPVTLPRTQ
jgi:hypothetical protein